MRVEAENRVVHGGTYTGSPVALAAAAAVLGRISAEPGLYDDLERSARLADGLEAAFAAAGINGHVRRIGSMLQPFTTARPEREPRTPFEVGLLQDEARYSSLCDALERTGSTPIATAWVDGSSRPRTTTPWSRRRSTGSGVRQE